MQAVKMPEGKDVLSARLFCISKITAGMGNSEIVKSPVRRGKFLSEEDRKDGRKTKQEKNGGWCKPDGGAKEDA